MSMYKIIGTYIKHTAVCIRHKFSTSGKFTAQNSYS